MSFKPIHIHLDQGHGGPDDRGAVHGNAVEAIIVLDISRILASGLLTWREAL